MANEYLYDRQGRIVGRLDQDKAYDRKGAYQGRYGKQENRTYDRQGRLFGSGDQRTALIKKP